MKKLMPLLLTGLFLLTGTMNAPAAKKITVTGTFVDTKCYGMASAMGKPEMNFGNTHMVPGKDGKMMKVPNCATACAGLGIPTGIVEGSKAGNKTYVLITSTTALKDHMAKEARVTGELVFEGGIIADKVEVKENGKWVDVTPASMM